VVADSAFVLNTSRLTMRRWRSSDLEPFAAMNADPEVMRYFPAPLDRAASDAFVARIESRFDERGYGLWALEVSATGVFIGFTGLNPMPDGVPGTGGTEVGWRLARSAWGQGYATEAGRAALELAFNSAGLPEVWSLTAEVNAPSIAVMRRLGLSYVTTALHPALDPTSELAPHVFYRIRAAEYRTA
jgi:RimJ/RimL family protein N-acetyltransferase